MRKETQWLFVNGNIVASTKRNTMASAKGNAVAFATVLLLQALEYQFSDCVLSQLGVILFAFNIDLFSFCRNQTFAVMITISSKCNFHVKCVMSVWTETKVYFILLISPLFLKNKFCALFGPLSILGRATSPSCWMDSV